MHRGKTRALFAAATIAAYLAAFFLPAWHDSSVPSGWFGPSFHGQTISGAGAFVMALFVIGLPMWLANPAFWFGLFSLGLFSLGRGWPRAAKISSAIAVLLALSELPVFWREV
ncbi:MAG TPA: hypothetical protein VHR72_15600, partial [Gemmataceae bacterium]|nr:hypothetical protein [Gemmataceae bacterium]